MPKSRPGRRSAPRPHSQPVPHSPGAPCPCGLPAAYGDCCGRYHSGHAEAPTAEALMRSRYSAYAVRDAAYVLRTWHPETRPADLDLDRHLRWERLEILSTTDGSAFHSEGTVAFRAHYSLRGEHDAMEEHSRFIRHEGAWVYVAPLP
ncbi:YchJ family metal-binding protein [Streptomyces sp. NPDC026673]|uniref:YchJ family protein n=1 Tax=Streptomyces sp. NPDC026673 TaxID=3155724 RepID=UPI0034091BF8